MTKMTAMKVVMPIPTMILQPHPTLSPRLIVMAMMPSWRGCYKLPKSALPKLQPSTKARTSSEVMAMSSLSTRRIKRNKHDEKRKLKHADGRELADI